MSKLTDRKKARRQKRRAKRTEWETIVKLAEELADDDGSFDLAPRNVTEVVLGVGGSLEADEYPDDVIDLVKQAEHFEQRITKRGWLFYSDLSTFGHATWYWVPSECVQPEDDMREQFTSVALRISDDDNAEVYDFPTSVHLFLVGCDNTGHLHYQLSPDEFFEHLDAIEAFRVNDPNPTFG